ncbi:MAG: hypothetical protein EOP54_09545 [Sphingobacteriales bacterium]|nr:MAG: hypothetical protein EOP54_09545 [Sphingobacteriales bacterium]
MDQNREDILLADINKQTTLGFSEEEIRQNLHLNGYMQEEITKAMKLARQSPAAVVQQKKSSPWSLLISLFFIIRGIMYFSKGQNTMGFLMTGVGFIGFILKAVSMRRN